MCENPDIWFQAAFLKGCISLRWHLCCLKESVFLTTRLSAVISLCKFESSKLVALWFFVFGSSFSNCRNVSRSVHIYLIFFFFFLVICRLLTNPFHSYCKYVFSVEIRSWTSSSLPERNMPTQVLDSPKIGSPLGLSYKMLKPLQYFDQMNESKSLDLSGTKKMIPPLVTQSP